MPKVVLLDVVADDTDVAILLLYHWHEALHDIYFTSEKSRRIWSIEQVANKLSADFKDIILFICAVSGCDSTSAISGKG